MPAPEAMGLDQFGEQLALAGWPGGALSNEPTTEGPSSSGSPGRFRLRSTNTSSSRRTSPKPALGADTSPLPRASPERVLSLCLPDPVVAVVSHGDEAPPCAPSRRQRRNSSRSAAVRRGGGGTNGGVGREIRAIDGSSWGQVVAEESSGWRLADGRLVKKKFEGKKWCWAPDATRTPGADVQHARPHCTKIAVATSDADHGSLPDTLLLCVSHWLPLVAVLRLTMTCSRWKALLAGYAPLILPPPQADKLLQFCLLEILVCFDEKRLPLPITALYGEMRGAARRAATDPHTRKHLEASIVKRFGTTCSAQQDELLREGRPHHVWWEAEIKNSGFRNLERFAKHFSEEKLISSFRQRWFKRVHNSVNVRQCHEWVLTRVYRSHPLFLEHERWKTTAERS